MKNNHICKAVALAAVSLAIIAGVSLSIRPALAGSSILQNSASSVIDVRYTIYNASGGKPCWDQILSPSNTSPPISAGSCRGTAGYIIVQAGEYAPFKIWAPSNAGNQCFTIDFTKGFTVNATTSLVGSDTFLLHVTGNGLIPRGC